MEWVVLLLILGTAAAYVVWPRPQAAAEEPAPAIEEQGDGSEPPADEPER